MTQQNRVVLVDDHELFAESLALVLRSRGLNARWLPPDLSGGPTQLLTEVQRLRPALVLLDLDLGSGGESIPLIRPLRDAGLRVVVLTGVTERLAHARCLEAGAVGVLDKAMSLERLCQAVAQAVGGRPLIAPATRSALLTELMAVRTEEAQAHEPFERLTPREAAVLRRLVAGEAAQFIASQSYVTVATIRSQIQSIHRKLGVRSQLEAVALAQRAGWPADGGRDSDAPAAAPRTERGGGRRHRTVRRSPQRA